jgi:hypothetical protein
MCARIPGRSVESVNANHLEVTRMKRWIGTGLAAGALAAAIGAGGPASAQDGPEVLRLTSVEQHCATADNGRRGESLGDLTACRGVLRNENGARVGRAHWTCTYLGSTKRGDDCSAVVNLSGGTLQAAGVLNHTSPRSEWAITGGTGRYAGARGTATLRQASPTRTTAVITLLR